MPFIVVEGIDGSGKSTIAKAVSDILKEYKKPTILTREPGGIKIAEEIRNVILSTDSHDMDPWTEVLLYIAARMEHVSKIIRPALQTHKYVVCDRFVDSTIAYQGYGRGLPTDKILSIQNILLKDIQPDLIIFVNMKYEEISKRILKRGKTANRFDLETVAFFTRVYNGFRAIAAADTSSIYVSIRGDLNEVEMRKEIKKILEERLNISDIK